MRTSIEGERALIVGATGGLGKAIAQRLASLGANVVLVGRKVERLEELKEKCLLFGSKRADTVPCDINDEASIKAMAEIVRQTGGLDILVNAAGVVANALLEKTSTADFDRIFSTNVRGTFIVMRECLDMLRASKAAEIINMASAAAHYGTKGQSAYGASKFAVLGLSETFALEIWEEGIHVHVLSPGGVLTDMIKDARPDLEGVPMIAPDDIADAVEYLVCHRTGATVDEIRIRRTSRPPTF